MSTHLKTLTLRLTPADYAVFSALAEAECLPLTTLVRRTVLMRAREMDIKPKPVPRKFTHMAPRNATGAIVGNLLGEDVHNRVQAGETLSEVLESYDVPADFVKGTYERQLARMQEESENERFRQHMQEKYKRAGGVVVDAPDEEDLAAQLDHLFDDDDVVIDTDHTED